MSAKAKERVLMLLQGQLFRDGRQQCWHAVKLSPWQRWQLAGSDSAALTIPRLQLNVKISYSYSLARAHIHTHTRSLPWEFLNVFFFLKMKSQGLRRNRSNVLKADRPW